MPKQTSNTAEQLRKLMQSHVEHATSKSEMASKATDPRPTAYKADSAGGHSFATSTPRLITRYSVRLLSPEIDKINSIIQSTLEQTGERVSLSDVLRIGINRAGESSAIARHEIVYLRKGDGRRSRSEG